MKKITPILAAFEFDSADHARAAWRTVRDDGSMKGVSVWAVATPDYRHHIVVILGEQQANVDRCAERVMAAAGCRCNYVLTQPMMDTFMQRRYKTLAAELAKAPDQRQIHQEASYGAGAPMYPTGEIGEPEDG